MSNGINSERLAPLQEHRGGIAVAFLLLAFLEWPYGFYILLRWIVLVAGGLLAWTAYRLSNTTWVLIGVALMIVFNPIAPVHLARSTWQVLDLVGVGLFGLSFMLRPERPAEESG